MNRCGFLMLGHIYMLTTVIHIAMGPRFFLRYLLAALWLAMFHKTFTGYCLKF